MSKAVPDITRVTKKIGHLSGIDELIASRIRAGGCGDLIDPETGKWRTDVRINAASLFEIREPEGLGVIESED